MSEFSGGAAMRKISDEEAGAGPARSHAVLFYHLARFVVWGQQHKNLIASDRELLELLSDATTVLASSGTPVQSSDF